MLDFSLIFKYVCFESDEDVTISNITFHDSIDAFLGVHFLTRKINEKLENMKRIKTGI